jgi:hypothetical protein
MPRAMIPAITFAGAAAFSPQAIAQTPLTLSQHGGALGEDATFTIQGEPARDYILWFDLVEYDTTLPTGVVTNVGFGQVGYSFMLPGFVGRTNASGAAVATIGVPNDPALAGLVFSLQTLYLDHLDEASNFTRFTPSASESFRPTLDDPDLPILSGLASPQADGTVLLVDTTLPLIHRYTPSLEQFDVVDLNCALGLLATATTLDDGRILVSGGIDPAIGQPQTRAILLDPATGTTTELDMGTPRAGHSAAMTSKGELLISGGFTNLDFTDITALFSGISNTSELFDPVSETFRGGPDLLESKALHSSTTTEDGKVLVAGGLTLIPFVDIPFVSVTAYVYDPKFDIFGLPLLLNEGRLLHGAALLDDKRILLAGGINIDFSVFLSTGNLADLILTALDTGDVWKKNIFGGSFTKATGMQFGRALPAVTALPNGEALVAGGFDLYVTGTDWTQWVFAPQSTADLFVPTKFQATGGMNEVRIAPISVVLSDGSILLVGGAALGAEIYQR